MNDSVDNGRPFGTSLHPDDSSAMRGRSFPRTARPDDPAPAPRPPRNERDVATELNERERAVRQSMRSTQTPPAHVPRPVSDFLLYSAMMLVLVLPSVFLSWTFGASTTIAGVGEMVAFFAFFSGLEWIAALWIGLRAFQWIVPIALSSSEMFWQPVKTVLAPPGRVELTVFTLAIFFDLFTTFLGLPLATLPPLVAFVQEALFWRITGTLVITFLPEVIMIASIITWGRKYVVFAEAMGGVFKLVADRSQHALHRIRSGGAA